MNNKDREKCIECGNVENLTLITLCEDNGFCQSGKHVNICKSCYMNNSQFTQVGHFLKLKQGLYHNHGFESFDKIYNKKQLEYIFNQDFFDLVSYINQISRD